MRTALAEIWEDGRTFLCADVFLPLLFQHGRCTCLSITEETRPQLSQLRAKEGHGESHEAFVSAGDFRVGSVMLMQEYRASLIQTMGSSACLTHGCHEGSSLLRITRFPSTRGCTGPVAFPDAGWLSTSSPGAVRAGGICYKSSNESHAEY